MVPIKCYGQHCCQPQYLLRIMAGMDNINNESFSLTNRIHNKLIVTCIYLCKVAMYMELAILILCFCFYANSSLLLLTPCIYRIAGNFRRENFRKFQIYRTVSENKFSKCLQSSLCSHSSVVDLPFSFEI